MLTKQGKGRQGGSEVEGEEGGVEGKHGGNLEVEREEQDVGSVGGSIKTEGVRQHLTH